jgi:chorismate mutase/prephenate dehydrogenase
MFTKEEEKELATLRLGIDRMDENIISLLAERKALVNRVGELKDKYSMPAFHPAREEDIITERRNRSEAKGLDPDHVEEIFRCILKESRSSQTRRIARKAVRPDTTVLIIGADGDMGRYFRRWFRDAGYTVRGLEKPDWRRAGELCDGIGLAIVSVPIDATVPVIEEIAPFLPPDCILTDLTSIKSAPMAAMLSAHPGPVLGLHPLFGPTTSTMDRQTVAVTPGRRPDDCRWVLNQLTAWGAVLVETDADAHDDIMAIVQSLRHFATFSFGEFLRRKKIDLRRSLEFSSPIYRLELGMVGRLFAQDAALYSEIIFATPKRRSLLKEYITGMTESIEMLEKGDKDAFNLQFKKIAEWFGPFSGQAMRESTYLIDKLIERF